MGYAAVGDLTGKQTIEGSPYLLLANRNTLKDTDHSRPDALLQQNQPLSSLYTLKEQLRHCWQQPASPADMAARDDDWRAMALAAKISGLARFVKATSRTETPPAGGMGLPPLVPRRCQPA